jgi:hypothetical protein
MDLVDMPPNPQIAGFIRLVSSGTPAVTVSEYYQVSRVLACDQLPLPSPQVLPMRMPVDVTWYPAGDSLWVSTNFVFLDAGNGTLISPMFPGFGGGLCEVATNAWTPCEGRVVPGVHPKTGLMLVATREGASLAGPNYTASQCSSDVPCYDIVVLNPEATPVIPTASTASTASLAQAGNGDGDSGVVTVQVGLSSGVQIGILVVMFVIMVLLAAWLGLYVART